MVLLLCKNDLHPWIFPYRYVSIDIRISITYEQPTERVKVYCEIFHILLTREADCCLLACIDAFLAFQVRKPPGDTGLPRIRG